jgi:hypothetical protein
MLTTFIVNSMVIVQGMYQCIRKLDITHYIYQHILVFRKLRHTAYRQLVCWCWQYLGRKLRVVLPSCAVSKIRDTFPSQSASYVGFKI